MKDAGFHAVVADTVTGACAHGIVNDDRGERADGNAFAFQEIHLRDTLFQWAACKHVTERTALIGLRDRGSGISVRDIAPCPLPPDPFF